MNGKGGNNMSDNLLNKKKGSLLQRKEEIKPKESFSRDSIYTVTKTEDASSKNKEISRKKIVDKTTTIRCSATTSNRLNAIVTSFGLDSVNELLEILIDNYETSLTPDERREIKTLVEVYGRKAKK
jgi:N-methylhydantoinase B/oxoprolinase/acetone carboxylase alpha subunit